MPIINGRAKFPSIEVVHDVEVWRDLVVRGFSYTYSDNVVYANRFTVGGKNVVIPPAPGADAIVVRDVRDVENKIRLTEDGKIILDPDVNLYRSAVDVLKTDDNFDARALRIGGVEVLDSARLLKNTRIACVSKGLTPVVVTETVLTLKQELTPDEGFYGFPYIEGIRVTATNSTGSTVTLYFITRALLDDGTEIDLHSEISVAEGASFDDWIRWIYDVIPNGRTIKAIRLYARVSATPTSGYEPSVNIERVSGVMV
jgi:hypothetical protein